MTGKRDWDGDAACNPKAQVKEQRLFLLGEGGGYVEIICIKINKKGYARLASRGAINDCITLKLPCAAAAAAAAAAVDADPLLAPPGGEEGM